MTYEVEIVGVDDDALRQLLLATSQLVALKDRPPATEAGLRRRVAGDLERFDTVLRSEGFYASRLEDRVVRDPAPARVTISVDSGVSYLLADYRVRCPDRGAGCRLALEPEAIGLHIGMVARAAAIRDAERRVVRLLRERGYPFAEVAERRVVVDHDDTTVEVELEVSVGEEARFGALAVEGLRRVDEAYVRRLSGDFSGRRYDIRLAERVRAELLDTGLFDAVELAPAATVTPTGELPHTLRLTERKHRSLGAGASFTSSEGPSAELFWEHRNLLRRGEDLRLSLTGSEIEQELAAEFRKPNFLRRRQTWFNIGRLGRQETDAFEELSMLGESGLERSFGRYLSASASVPLEIGRFDEASEAANYLLVGLRLAASRDSSDGLLDPTRGSRVRLSMTPFTGTADRAITFLINEVSASAYYAPLGSERLVLAGRARFGSIVGADNESIPINKRFFAGGDGSVRGYEFQAVGPLDALGDPRGGSSVVEAGLEVRARLGDKIGIVPFIEGGMVNERALPDLGEEILWAAGLGVRYFTVVGPIRVDIAFPLNGRDVDDAFQFYISFGQAF